MGCAIILTKQSPHRREKTKILSLDFNGLTSKNIVCRNKQFSKLRIIYEVSPDEEFSIN